MSRLVEISDIPNTLWDTETQTLKIPPVLATAYCRVVDLLGLRDLADARDSANPPLGGLNQEDADQHFAQAFDGSVARAELAILDPKNASTATSNSLFERLAGNHICLTDAPCGAGAASLAFLSTIAELRREEVLPRLPLQVSLIGAEISGPARCHAEAMFDSVRPELETQAIFVQEEFLHWDVTDDLSNTDLIRRMTIKSATTDSRLVVVANFTGFLEKERKRKVAHPKLEELFRHASGNNSSAIWIEPAMNRAIAQGGLFDWIKSLLKDGWNEFARESGEGVGRPIAKTEAKFELPLDPENTATVRLAVLPIDLVRKSE